MTYQEALLQLSEVYPNPFEYDSRLRQTIIVPDLEKDFVAFLSDFRERKTTLENVVSYSTNSKFKLWSGDTEFYNI